MARSRLPESYRLVFDRNKAATGRVLANLAKFCRATSTSLVVSTDANGGGARLDPLATAAAEGRREVFLHIMKQLNLDLDAIYELEKTDERERASERE